jgi:hypothetical protein
MTVTEGGYYIDPATGRFDATHPAIVADAASPDAPRTVFGHILRALKSRREAGVPPFTVLSCDNVPHNGVVTLNAIAGLAAATDPALADWVRAELACPNGMVDRIAPATGPREQAILRDDFGVEDAWPVFCEDFAQWVLEDRFPQGRPALEAVGVTFVGDVTPFETMKIRILNGGHAIIAYPRACSASSSSPTPWPTRWCAASSSASSARRSCRSCRPCPTPTSTPTSPASSSASPTPRSATPCAGSASTARTASRSSSCRRSPTGWRRARRSRASRSPPPSGAATAPAPPTRASRSRRTTPTGTG